MFEKERLEHAIAYFAQEHYKRARKYLTQTGLYKYLAFMDFWGMEQHGRPVLSLTYKALERGPVPIELYEQGKWPESLLFQIKKQDTRVEIHPKSKPDLDYFSNQELKEMQRLTEIYGDPTIMTEHFSDASHEKILAWKRTRQLDPNGIIPYELTFPGDIDKKSEENLTPEEESFLIYRGFRKLCENR